jgi:hypothetical protein
LKVSRSAGLATFPEREFTRRGDPEAVIENPRAFENDLGQPRLLSARRDPRVVPQCQQHRVAEGQRWLGERRRLVYGRAVSTSAAGTRPALWTCTWIWGRWAKAIAGAAAPMARAPTTLEA